MKPLDLEDVQAFAKVADLLSFTRAADELNTTQSVISTKIKRLEERLNLKLLERTPRKVKLSPKGELFLGSAHMLLATHDLVISKLGRERIAIKIGVSQYIIGSNLPLLLRRLHDAHPHLLIDLYVGSSRDVEVKFDNGQVDAAFILRHQDSRDEGQILVKEDLGWMAQPDWESDPGQPLKLAMHAHPCRIRALAIDALEEAQIPWIEIFAGGDAATVGAAAQAGLAVGVLVQSVAPAGTLDVGPRLKLPKLPSRDVVLYSNTSDTEIRTALRILADIFRIGFGRTPAPAEHRLAEPMVSSA